MRSVSGETEQSAQHVLESIRNLGADVESMKAEMTGFLSQLKAV